jgi:type III restriction enzyme
MPISEVQVFKQKDLVLTVDKNFNPEKLDIEAWGPFINRLCGDREFQKEAIINSIVYLASGRYSSIDDLVKENYSKNLELQKRYSSLDDYLSKLQLPNKLFANIDLATGTGKSYVIYGIAQIMLGLGFVDRVLVLCPSLTIEAGLTEKFNALSGNANLKNLIPSDAIIKNPSIITANNTIKKGDICVENIHAVYINTGSSIEDSLKGIGESVLVLNDESHHIFNKVSGNTAEDRDFKKWKEFLLSKDYGFKYMLGFTGTAYINDEYFNDVIYRYSLRDAIENKVVKNIDYVKEDDSNGDNEKFQKIYQNHRYNIEHYPLVKPLTILLTKDIPKAKRLKDDLVEFLTKQEHKTKNEIEEKVLIVTSHKDHKANVSRLKYVDDKSDKTEWIVSVSMLTEGWDVKNVFQIVPWVDRAFNSKLLVAQVLGRGLRIPLEYSTIQPRVIVFNHKSWNIKIRKLVDEILEIEARVYSEVLSSGDRVKYNFDVYNINYKHNPEEIDNPAENTLFNYTRLLEEGIELESQALIVQKETLFDSAIGNHTRKYNYAIEGISYTIDEILDMLYDSFDQMEWEGKTLQLGENEYTQNKLPPREKIKQIIEFSMKRRGNIGDRIIEKNCVKILNTFNTLLRRSNKTTVYKPISDDMFTLSTRAMEKQSTALGNLKTKDYTLFYSNDWRNEISNKEQLKIISELLEDESRPFSALKEINKFFFKTPVNTVITSFEPERKFLELLCEKNNSKLVYAWIKSRDRGFYCIEYSIRQGSKDSKTRKYSHRTFNPDFFILLKKDDLEYILVIETKADGDNCDENKAKYKFASEHFKNLNEKLAEQGIKQKYIFHFLSPKSYQVFFNHLKNGTLLKNQDSFQCELELSFKQE